MRRIWPVGGRRRQKNGRPAWLFLCQVGRGLDVRVGTELPSAPIARRAVVVIDRHVTAAPRFSLDRRNGRPADSRGDRILGGWGRAFARLFHADRAGAEAPSSPASTPSAVVTADRGEGRDKYPSGDAGTFACTTSPRRTCWWARDRQAYRSMRVRYRWRRSWK